MDYRQIYLKLLNLKNRMEQFEKTLLAKHDLTRNDTLIISALGISDLTLSELVKTCCIDKSTVTKVVKKLEGDGYLQKQAEHKRGYPITLTDKGRALNEKAVETFNLLKSTENGFLTEEETATLSKLLDKLLNVSDDKIAAEITQRINQ